MQESPLCLTQWLGSLGPTGPTGTAPPPRCNAMNEVWVPSEWQRQSFIASGVEASKIRVVPEGVNTTQFDPARYERLPDLAARAQLVFGRPWAERQRRRRSARRAATAAAGVGWGAELAGAAAAAALGSAPEAAAVPEQAEGQQDAQEAATDGRSAELITSSSSSGGSSGADRPASRGGERHDGSSGTKAKDKRRLAAHEPFRFISSFKWEVMRSRSRVGRSGRSVRSRARRSEPGDALLEACLADLIPSSGRQAVALPPLAL
jgi:hypothetical protein